MTLPFPQLTRIQVRPAGRPCLQDFTLLCGTLAILHSCLYDELCVYFIIMVMHSVVCPGVCRLCVITVLLWSAVTIFDHAGLLEAAR